MESVLTRYLAVKIDYVKCMYVKLDRRKDKYIYMCASFFRLEFRERGAL